MKSAQSIWKSAVPMLKEGISEVTFNTWFSSLKPVGIDGSAFKLMAPSPVVENVISHMYKDYIKNALFVASQTEFEVTILIEGQQSHEEDTVYTPTTSIPTSIYEDENTMPLDKKFIFDEFVVGPNNEFAHAASLGVVQNPSTKYNPLLIYGGTGLGKTHLMHAIGNELKRKRPDWRILYITSERFTNELVEAIHKRTNTEFRERYRKIDVLLIDDIQFFAGKESTQEEFFHTFNELKNSGKQIVLTSDRPPKDIHPLEERIRTRIEGGLMADIQPPDYETRLAILRKKLESTEFNVGLPFEVLDLIATQVKSNIRELEGAIKKVVAYKEISHKDIDLCMANSILRDYFSTIHNQRIDAKMVIKTVEQYFNLNNDAIISKKRDKKISYPRHIAMFICRELTDMSLPQIGNEFGGRDHSTVLTAINKIKKEMESNLSALNTINELVNKINN